MTRIGKIAATTAGFLLIVLVFIIVAIATFDWNRLKPIINENVSAGLHRPFAIRGDLGVAWSRQEDETGWRSWIPWPRVYAEGITLGNPTGLPQMTMLSLQRVEATLAPLVLLHKTVWLPWVKLVTPDVRLISITTGLLPLMRIRQ